MQTSPHSSLVPAMQHSTMAPTQELRMEHPEAISVIGFPLSELHFMRNKFEAYGRPTSVKVVENCLHIKYDSTTAAQRALVEDGRWICTQSTKFLICVKYTETLQPHPSHSDAFSAQSGTFLNTNYGGRTVQHLSPSAADNEQIQRSTDFSTRLSQFFFSGW